MTFCSKLRVLQRLGKLGEAREGRMEGWRVTGVAVNLGRAACLLFVVSMSVSVIKKGSCQHAAERSPVIQASWLALLECKLSLQRSRMRIRMLYLLGKIICD